MKCIQCGSSEIVEDVEVVYKTDGTTHSVGVEAYKEPGAFFFKGATWGKLLSRICVQCGCVMPFISPEDAKQIQKTLMQQKK